MNWKTMLSVFLCLSMIFICSGFNPVANTAPDSSENSEVNVIIASDAGGGDLSKRDMLKWAVVISISILLIILLHYVI